ncbi:MAG: flagellar protein FlaG [bacterium]
MSDSMAINSAAVVAPKTVVLPADNNVKQVKPTDNGQSNAVTGTKAPVETQASRESATAQSNLEQVENAVNKLNVFSEKSGQALNFSVDDGSGKTIISVVDKTTDELIRQIPSEEALRVAAFVAEQGGFSDPVLSTLGLNEKV